MMLLKFKSFDRAAEFLAQYDGKPFSSMHTEICHAAFVERIELDKVSDPSFATELPTCPVCLGHQSSSLLTLESA
jgi:hypothetical protein